MEDGLIEGARVMDVVQIARLGGGPVIVFVHVGREIMWRGVVYALVNGLCELGGVIVVGDMYVPYYTCRCVVRCRWWW